MSGSSKDGKDELLGIFSARGTQTRIGPLRSPTTPPAAPTAPKAAAPSTPAPNANPTALPAVQKQAEATQSVVDKSRGPSKAAAVNRQSELSPTGSIVMREVRRELGSDLSLQQQMNNPAMTEKVIASAVDKVLKKRGETIDDIERANITEIWWDGAFFSH